MGCNRSIDRLEDLFRSKKLNGIFLGSGKTFVALYACINHLQKTRNPKIVFLVPRVPLVKQQFELFKRCRTSRPVLYCILVVTIFFKLASQIECSVKMFKLSRRYFSLGEVYSFIVHHRIFGMVKDFACRIVKKTFGPSSSPSLSFLRLVIFRILQLIVTILTSHSTLQV